MLRRRDFLKSTLAASALLPLVSPACAAFGLAPGAGDRRKTLLILELTGGNDGLNTVVPFEDDRYHRARPALRLAKNAVHRLDAHTALAPALEGLARLHADGHLAVVQGVGMPEPDRSHFVSLHRWHTGDASGRRRTGWLARTIDELPAAKASPLPALALGSRDLPAMLSGTRRPATACLRLAELVPDEKTRAALLEPEAEALEELWSEADEKTLARAGRDLLRHLEAVMRGNGPRVNLPGTALGRALGDALRLLDSDLHVPAIVIRLGGFDTHARQEEVHPELLRILDRALVPFFRHLLERKRNADVLTLVYSEFGRRVHENGSRGTDHGSGGPAFLLGGDVPGGLYGDRPDLANLDQGDVRATVDFRRLLATGLDHLGHADARRILGPAGRPLGFDTR